MAKVITKFLLEQKDIPCCAYARVSTFSDEQEYSLDNQQTYWNEKLAKMPNHKYVGIFADQGISGSKVQQRKQYCRMIELAKAGFIKEIYTKSIYRFARNLIETLTTVRELRNRNVAIIFEEQEINTLTCSNDFFMNLSAHLAEQELSSMSENVKFAARHNFQLGTVPKTIMLGYDYDENGHLIINQDEAKIVRLIYSLYAKGHGLAWIVNQLWSLKIPTVTGKAEWSATTISKILKNERYIGDALLQKTHMVKGKKMPNNGEVDRYYIRNDHEPIIDRELFEFVQHEIARRSSPNKGKAKPQIYPLTGKIICANCGASYRHRTNNKIVNFDKAFWTCSRADRLGKSACDSNLISATLLNEMLCDAYNDFVETPFELLPDTTMAERVKEIRMTIEKLRRLQMDGIITREQYKTETSTLKDEESQLVDKMRDYQLISIYKKPRTTVKEYNDELVRHIDKIVIDGYKVKFIFRNGQKIMKEFKYEHRKYCKNY